MSPMTVLAVLAVSAVLAVLEDWLYSWLANVVSVQLLTLSWRSSLTSWGAFSTGIATEANFFPTAGPLFAPEKWPLTSRTSL